MIEPGRADAGESITCKAPVAQRHRDDCIVLTGLDVNREFQRASLSFRIRHFEANNVSRTQLQFFGGGG
jgi:hypothetical protein